MIDPTIDLQVGSTADDVYYSSAFGDFLPTGYDGYLFAGVWENQGEYIGMRFTNVTVPQGVIIQSATMQVYGEGVDGDINGIRLKIWGDAADNPAAWSHPGQRPDQITQTTAGVDWDPATWPNWGSPEWVTTPDISPIVQEIVNRPGWTSGNAMRFAVWNDGTIPPVGSNNNVVSWHDYYSGAALAAKISIRYTNIKTFLGEKDESFLHDGLIGYWKMDESSWTNNCSTPSVADSSGNNHHGRSCPNAGGITTTSAGKFGRAGDFDGSNDYISIPDHASLRPGDGSWTVSAWANPANSNQSSALVTKNQSGSPYEMWGMYICGDVDCINSGQQLTFIYQESSASSWRKVTSDTDIADGGWHHYMAVADKASNTLRLYVDGVEVASIKNDVGSWPNIDNTQDLIIGSDNGNSYPFDGLIDEVRIYNRALSPLEAEKLYQWSPDPISYWSFEEGSGSTTTDLSGGGNDLTLYNNPTWSQGRYGKGLSFNGTNQSAYRSSPNLNLNRKSFTVSAWIHPNSVSGYNGIISQAENGGNPRWAFLVWNDGTLRIEMPPIWSRKLH